MTTETGDLLAELDSEVQVDNAPYIGATSFEELAKEHGSKELLDGLYEKGFKRPSKIQAAALPIVLCRDKGMRNLIAQGQSGTGKTATYVLGMYSIVDKDVEQTQAVCLEPTRELARQTFGVCTEIGKHTGIKAELLVPGYRLPRSGLIRGQVVVGTPGIVTEAFRRRCIDPKLVMMLAVDEADHMLQANLGEQTAFIRSQLSANVKVTLFSATFPDTVKAFADKIAPDARKITLKASEVVLRRITQLTCRADEEHSKFDIIDAVFSSISIGQTIIFANSKRACEELTRDLVSKGHMVSILHGDIMKEDRDRVIDAFTQGKTRVLVTTNVLARGIDVMQVSLVINYEVPMHHKAEDSKDEDEEADTETYIHRIGRTARFGRSGVALNLVASEEEFAKLDDILCELNCESHMIEFDKIGELDKLLKECRRRDEENVRRLGLPNSTLPELSKEQQSLIPKKHRSHRSHAPKAATAADAAAPAAPSELSAAAPPSQ